MLYFLPETDCTTSYLNNVPDLEIEVAMDVCCKAPGEDVSDNFIELANILMNENSLQMPTKVCEAEALYCDLILLIENI